MCPPPWAKKNELTMATKKIMSPISAKNIPSRQRVSSCRGPFLPRCPSQLSPSPPPPVGRRETGGLPPMPVSLRSVSTGIRVKVTAITISVNQEITPDLLREHLAAKNLLRRAERDIHTDHER